MLITVVVSGVGWVIWVIGVGILIWLESSMRSCNGSVMSWGVLWWWMRRMCRAFGSVLGFWLCGGAVGSR